MNDLTTSYGQEKAVKKFLEDRTIYLVHSNGVVRKLFKTILEELGLDPRKFRSFRDISELTITDVDFLIIRRDSEEMEEPAHLDDHLKERPNRLDACYISIVDDNSLAITTKAAEFDVDLVISNPSSAKAIQDAFFNKIMEMINPSDTAKKYYKARELFYNKNLEKAEEEFIKLANDSSVGIYHYYLARIYHESNRIDEVIPTLKKGLQIESDQYKILIWLYKLYYDKKDYVNAYNTASMIVEKYPITHDRIGDFIRLALATENFEDIFGFSSFIKKSKITNENFLKTYAAAMAMSAKYLINKKSSKVSADMIFDAIKTAEQLGRQSPAIMKIVTQSYLSQKRHKDADRALSILKNMDESDETKVLDLLVSEKLKIRPGDILTAANKLTDSGIVNLDLNLLIVRTSIRAGLKRERIIELIEDYKGQFPNQADRFEKYIGKIRD